MYHDIYNCICQNIWQGFSGGSEYIFRSEKILRMGDYSSYTNKALCMYLYLGIGFEMCKTLLYANSPYINTLRPYGAPSVS